ncbi:hypothetical protein D3C73_958610 [compost metagenome]
MESQGFKRNKALIVVHGQYGIKLLVAAIAKETVGRVWSENHHAFIIRFLNGRTYNFCLF